MKISNLKINPNAIRKHRKMGLRALIGTAALVTAIPMMAYAATSAKETNHIKNSTVNEVITEYNGVSDITDDLNKSAIGDVETLEHYLKISEELHDLDLDCNFVDLTERHVLLSASDLDIAIETYKKDKKSRDRLTVPLAIQEELVNQFIAAEGYSIAASACKDTLKAVLADAKEEQEGTPYEKSDITIPGDTYHSQPEDRFVAGLVLPSCSHVESLLDSLYTMQNQAGRVYENGKDSPQTCAYNRTRNEMINTALNRLKVVLSHDYTATKKGTVKISK